MSGPSFNALARYARRLAVLPPLPEGSDAEARVVALCTVAWRRSQAIRAKYADQ